ncbi:MAG: SGNH/GDSL hydrolase family protein, partial [Oscillospiraceae bacterium]
ENYNPDLGQIETEKYVGTILQAGEDAGDEYVKETLFIGDSNTYRMMVYGETSLENSIGVVGMGVQQVAETPCVSFEGYDKKVTIPEAVAIMQPKRIVMTFGTNNTVGWSADSFKNDYKSAIDAIKAAYPYCDIIINSIPPVHQARDNKEITMKTIDALNLALVELAKENGLYFVNSAEVLKDKNSGYAKDQYTISDGLHMTKRAFDDMFKYIRTHSYITEDKRPEIKPVPKRTETKPEVVTSDPLINYSKSEGTSSGDSKKEGDHKITFTTNSKKMGTIVGTTEQMVNGGEKCSIVTAVPAEGYVFVKWSCNIGIIDDVKNKELTFVAPDWSSDPVTVTANFKKDKDDD